MKWTIIGILAAATLSVLYCFAYAQHCAGKKKLKAVFGSAVLGAVVYIVYFLWLFG